MKLNLPTVADPYSDLLRMGYLMALPASVDIVPVNLPLPAHGWMDCGPANIVSRPSSVAIGTRIVRERLKYISMLLYWFRT